MRVDAFEFGHITFPWSEPHLWIGTGAHGRLPVGEDVREEALRRGVELLMRPTPELVKLINQGLPDGTSVILHVTC